MKNNRLNDLQWRGNSKKMYDAILNEVPSLFMGTVKTRINDWIVKNNIQIVTEDIILKAVDDMAPANISNRIKTSLEKFRTKK